MTRAGRGLGPTAGRSAPQPGLLGPRLRRAPLWSSALTFRTRVVRHLGNVGQSHGPSSLRPYGLCVPRACENRMTSPGLCVTPPAQQVSSPRSGFSSLPWEALAHAPPSLLGARPAVVLPRVPL